MSVFFLFLLGLCLGSLSTLFWIPEASLGRGYFQLNALVILGLLALATAVAILHPFQPFGSQHSAGLLALGGGLAGAFLYYAAVWRERWDLCRWPLLLALVACLIALLLSGLQTLQSASPLPHRPVLMVTSLLTSAALLGWSLVTMLLGHWYLISPKLSFRYLVLFCWVLLGTATARIASVAASVGAAASVDELFEPHPFRLLVGLSGQGIFFWFRLLWGLAVPLTLAAMSLHCARRKSNQSATGILYVLLVGTVIGEITAYYLILTTGVPV